MPLQRCRECNNQVSDKADICPHCGITVVKNWSPEKITLDCGACKSEGMMVPLRISRFTFSVRFMGKVMVVLSGLGLVIGLAKMAIPWYTSLASIDTAILKTLLSNAGKIRTFHHLGANYMLYMSLALGSLIGEAIGWILLMKRKVYKCTRCGVFIDRD